MHSVKPDIFLSVFLFLLIPFLWGYVLKKLRIPAVIGYLLGGLLIGNTVGNLGTNTYINQFAFFGILLLMFTIGLEIHLNRLFQLKRYVIVGGMIQIFISFVAIALISLFFEFTLLQSVLIGIAFSSSSTMLVAKMIQDRGEESSFLGELTIGMLMFQDLAFIPFAIVFTFLNSSPPSPIELSAQMLGGVAKAMLIIMVMHQFGKRVVSYLFDTIAKTSRELLNLFIILFIFLVAYVSTILDMPIVIGMFIAGILVSQTSEHHHIFSQIRPIRDVLTIIFFVYIGSHVHLGPLMPVLPKLMLFTLLILSVKAIILLVLFIGFRFNTRIAFALAIFLFQVSESSFILMSVARANNIFSEDQYLFLLAAVISGMVVTPLIINNKDKIYLAIRTIIKKYLPVLDSFIKFRVDFRSSSIDMIEMKDHVVICGYGRVGSYIGRALTLAGIPYLAIDFNFHVVRKAKAEGVNIIYGDPTDLDILDFAQTEHAVALVAVVPERYSQEAIVLNAKKLNKNILLVGRTHRLEQEVRLRDLGVDVVVQPELEASVSIIKRLYLLKNLSREEIVRRIKHFKLEQGVH